MNLLPLLFEDDINSGEVGICAFDVLVIVLGVDEGLGKLQISTRK